MPFVPRSLAAQVQSVDLSRRVGFVVRLEGSDWSTTEVVRTLGGIGGIEVIELREADGAEELVIAGRPVAVAAAVRALAVDPVDRVRVLTRLHADFGITLVG